MARRVPFNRFLDADGDGSGSKSCAVNGSVSAVTRKLVADSNIYVESIIIMLADATPMEPGELGDITVSTTNGSELKMTIGGVTYDLTDGVKLNSNQAIAARAGNVQSGILGTTTNEMLVFKIDLPDVALNPDDEVQYIVNDDLTGLAAHTVMVAGYQEL